MTLSTWRGRFLQLTLALALLASAASAQSLTTTYGATSGFPGIMFDMHALSGPLLINDFDVNMDAGTWTVDVWVVTTGTTFEPHHGDITAWTLLGSSTVVTNGPGVPTPLGLSLGYYMPPGAQTGFYLTTTDNIASTSPINYSTGTAGGSAYASDTFLQIDEGVGKGLSGYPTTFSPTLGGGALPFPSTSSRIPNITVYYTPAASLADDVALTAISAPVDSVGCEFLSSTEAVSATIQSLGSNLIPMGTLIQLDLIVDGGATVSEFALLPNDLNLGDSYTHNFAATANVAAAGSHSISVTAMFVGDLDNSNDNLVKMVNSGNPATISSFPWSENFDGAIAQNSLIPPMGWAQDSADGSGTNSDWYMHTGATASVNTGPHADHTTGTTGYYAYVEDSSPNLAQVNLISPCIDLSGTTAPVLRFWMASYNGLSATYPDNNLSVDIITYPGGAIVMDAFGPQGALPGQAATWAANTATEWQQQTVNLAAYVGQTIQLRFRGQSDQTPQYNDIAIDDVSIFEPVVTNGQAPRPNLAVFDIENAVNANLAGVPSGLNGPYFAGVTQGAPFNMSFQGEPTQAIAVVYGALNPVSATYPGGIGQFDIGGPGVDPMGIPLNIAVFVNAIAWAQGGFNGFPLDSLFFTDAAGDCNVGFTMPNFGIPMGSPLTTFQAAITSSAAPFVYISNAVSVSIN